MKVTIDITVRRDDGTTLTRSESVESGRLYRYGGFVKETRKELRQRVDRLVRAGLNSTVGGHTT